MIHPLHAHVREGAVGDAVLHLADATPVVSVQSDVLSAYIRPLNQPTNAVGITTSSMSHNTTSDVRKPGWSVPKTVKAVNSSVLARQRTLRKEAYRSTHQKPMNPDDILK
jgi:hypothetical protein